MKYKLEIPNITHIATCDNYKELVQALQDGDCIKKVKVMDLAIIADSLTEYGHYVGKVSGDNHYSFTITAISDTLNI